MNDRPQCSYIQPTGMHRYEVLTPALMAHTVKTALENEGLECPENLEERIKFGMGSLTIRIERAWSVSADLHMDYSGHLTQWTALTQMQEVEDDKVWVFEYETNIQISWSSTYRSIAAAHAANILYGKVIAAAANIEAALADFHFACNANVK